MAEGAVGAVAVGARAVISKEKRMHVIRIKELDAGDCLPHAYEQEAVSFVDCIGLCSLPIDLNLGLGKC